jgi:hypothetical protein
VYLALGVLVASVAAVVVMVRRRRRRASPPPGTPRSEIPFASRYNPLVRARCHNPQATPRASRVERVSTLRNRRHAGREVYESGEPLYLLSEGPTRRSKRRPGAAWSSQSASRPSSRGTPRTQRHAGC